MESSKFSHDLTIDFAIDKINNKSVMFKRLLIPGIAISALALSVNPVKAASFTLDSFDNASNNQSQRVNVGRFAQPPRTLTQGTQANPLDGVFGGSRTLRINPPLQNPSNLLQAASIFADPLANQLAISNGPSVVSNSLTRYDANGLGLNTVFDDKGNSLGNWSSGRYDFDFFAVKINSVDTRLNMTFKIEDSMGRIAQLTRTISRANVNAPIVIDNPTYPQFSGLPANSAIFSFDEFLANNRNIDFRSVKAAQIEFTGQAGVDATVDFIEGVEVPEPSLGIGTLLVFGIGLASVKGNKNT